MLYNSSISNPGCLYKAEQKLGFDKKSPGVGIELKCTTRNSEDGKKRKPKKVKISPKKAATRIAKLQERLQSIQDTKQQQLAQIQTWKEQEMARIRQEYSRDLQAAAAVAKESERLDERVAKAKTIIAHLKRENKKLREKNKALRRAVDKMMDENELLTFKSSQFSETSETLTNNMKQMKDQKEYLESVIVLMKTHVEKFEEAIELRDDAVLCENRVGRRYLNAMREINELVEVKSDCEALVDEIDSCFVNAHKGTGIEETERDMSETVF